MEPEQIYKKIEIMRILIKSLQVCLWDLDDEGGSGKKFGMARTGFFIRQKKKDAVLIDKKRNRETNIEICW